MNDTPVTAVLVGTGGYASFYTNYILRTDQNDVRLVGTVDPTTEGLPDSGIPHWKDLDAFFAEAAAELTLIASPPMFHEQQLRTALQAGSHVLCEKPLFPTPAPLPDLVALRDRTRRAVGVGFQWSFSRPILELKHDILAERFGTPLSAKAIVLWPRSFQYYARNSWAGRVQDDRGNPVNDSVFFNATAHYFHNLTFLLGAAVDRSAMVHGIEAETYRAFDIENFDTIALRGATDTGVRVAYYASHAGETTHKPLFRMAFENATVHIDETRDNISIVAEFSDGTTKDYGDPNKDSHRKITTMAEAVRSNAPVPCTLETVRPHLAAVGEIQQRVDTLTIPASCIRREDERVSVPGMDADLTACYAAEALPFEKSCPWAAAAAS